MAKVCWVRVIAGVIVRVQKRLVLALDAVLVSGSVLGSGSALALGSTLGWREDAGSAITKLST